MTVPDRSPHPRRPRGRRRRPGSRGAPWSRASWPRPWASWHWGRRLAVGGALLVLASGSLGHGLIMVLQSSIHRVNAFGGLDDRPGRGHGGVTFLLVGTDRRDTVTPTERARYRLGGSPCNCTDTMLLVHLSAAHDRVSVISLPRDTYATIPAYTDPASGLRHRAHPQKLNAAYAEGGPSLTVRTVEHLTDVHVDHYLEVDFASFMKTVDAIGGVRVCTDRRLRDPYTGLDLAPGSHTLDGGQALEYVRSRHLDGSADLGRMQRQQRFLAAVLSRATGTGVLANPVRFDRVASALLGSVRADTGFQASDLIALGRAMRGVTPASAEFASVPVRGAGRAVPGIGSTVVWDRARADRLFRAIRADRPLVTRPPGATVGPLVPVAPGRIRVQVLNGTDTVGLARRVDGRLRAVGFATTGAPADAPVAARRTVVGYDPRWDRSARSLAAALPGARLRAARHQGAVLRVTLGTDFRSVRAVHTAPPVPPANAGTAVTGDQVGCG